ncbi:unnamed protein product [Ostreobium quekettii]|uniref:Transmembrane protein n=1 Tax=Ostreobium quekettii TaxID=121088 RepID=A0A8S1J0V7_9CHLO|nr:unnamed protein product [Ostreobium quekettii]
MNYLRKLVFAALVLCALAQWTHAQTLLLYPAVSLMEAMVYNNDLGELRNVQGAFPWFVCSSRNSTISGTELLPCASNLTLYTKLDETLLTMNFVSDEGRPRPFVPDDVEVVIGGEKWKAEFKQIGTAEFDIPLKFQSDTRPITVIAQEENETRQLNLVHDSTPPVLTVETLTPVVNTDERIPKARFAVQFSEDVIPVPKTGVFCNATLPGLLNNVSVGDLLNASMACPSGGELDFKGTFSVRGADKVSATFLVKNRRILIVATAKAGVPADIRLTVFKKVFIDFAGNVNEQGGSAQARYRPTVGIATSDIGARIARRTIVLSDDEVVVEEELEMPPDVSSAKAFGTASSAMVAAAAATSMAGGAAGGGGAGGGGGGGGALNILGLAQKMFMTGLVAIKNFPENYAAFVGELAWTVFDVDLPWEDDDNTTRTVTPFGIEREEEGEEEEFEGLESLLEADDDEDPKKHLLQVLMWISIAFLLVIVLHALLLSCCLCRRRPVPWLLAVPRLEIMLAFWAVPAITIAVAGLYKGDLGKRLKFCLFCVTVEIPLCLAFCGRCGWHGD